MPLSARSVVITGASRGIGLELVRQLLRLPSCPEVIVAGCRDPTSATDLHELAKDNSVLKIIKLDVDKDEDIEDAKKVTEGLVGDQGLNLLINNAGIFDKTNAGHVSLSQQTRDTMQRHFNTNVTSQILMTQAFLPLLKQASAQSNELTLSASKSAVVFITSDMGSLNTAFKTKIGCLHYSCPKSAMNMATILIADDLQKSGILVMSLHPGWLLTDMGGQKAPQSVSTGVKGCLAVIGQAGEEQQGRFSSYDGSFLSF